MKPLQILNLGLVAVVLTISACNNDKKAESDQPKEPKLKEENVTYSADSLTMNGYVVYDENKEGPRPAVLVVPEWWGLNDYAKMRARELAKLGYAAMAVDFYGNGKTADDPKTAGELAGPFYMTPEIAKPRFDAAVAKLKTYSQVDASKLAAIGYCFGGAQVLDLARMGEDLKGVVSFHGNLTVTKPDKNLMKAKILVCYGLDDQFVPMTELDQFKHQMDSVGLEYTLKTYPGAKHSFTNPNATAMGEKFKLPIGYNAAADSASWNDMKDFFGRIFQ